MTLDQITTEIRHLSVEQRKQLITLIVDSLTEPYLDKKHSILELEGLGAEIWQGLTLKNKWIRFGASGISAHKD